MATAVAVGDLLSLRCWTVLEAQAAVNTFNFSVVSTGGGAVTDQDFSTAIDANMAPFYKANCPSHVEYRGNQVYLIKRGAGLPLPPAAFTTANAGAGTASGNPTPGNAAPIISYRTNFRGPRGRGRVYIPFPADSWFDVNGKPSTAYMVLLNSLASFLLVPFVVSGGGTATFVWSLVQRVTHAPPILTGQIFAAEASGRTGTMKKRGDYGRPNLSPI